MEPRPRPPSKIKAPTTIVNGLTVYCTDVDPSYNQCIDVLRYFRYKTRNGEKLSWFQHQRQQHFRRHWKIYKLIGATQ